MNHARLHEELQLPAYAGLTDAQALALLAAEAVFVPEPRFVSYRTIRALVGKARTDAIAAAVAASDPLAHQMLLVPGGEDGSGGGVDASLAEFQAMVGQFEAGGLLTAQEASAVRGLGGAYVARASQIGCAGLAEADVAWVRNHWPVYVALRDRVRDRWNANQAALARLVTDRGAVPQLAQLDGE